MVVQHTFECSRKHRRRQQCDGPFAGCESLAALTDQTNEGEAIVSARIQGEQLIFEEPTPIPEDRVELTFVKRPDVVQAVRPIFVALALIVFFDGAMFVPTFAIWELRCTTEDGGACRSGFDLLILELAGLVYVGPFGALAVLLLAVDWLLWGGPKKSREELQETGSESSSSANTGK